MKQKSKLIIKETPNGKGVFSNTKIIKGDTVLLFAGNVTNEPSDSPYYLQIGEDAYLGPSNLIDDFVNHSCEPNCFVELNPVKLVALKDIYPNEEITFDYSTTSTCEFNDWSMICTCGSLNCRQLVTGFSCIPFGQILFYMKHGSLPDYILKKYFKQ